MHSKQQNQKNKINEKQKQKCNTKKEKNSVKNGVFYIWKELTSVCGFVAK